MTQRNLADNLLKVGDPHEPFEFLDEPLKVHEVKSTVERSHDFWGILVVDDDLSIFEVTKLALSDFTYRDRPLKFFYAPSAMEAQKVLAKTTDIALAMIDVVMEHQSSGLELVKYIRNELYNNQIQIILRTGQPGDIPAETLVQQFAINDYKVKTDLTREKLFTSVTVALRSYDQSSNVMDLAGRLMIANNKLNKINANLEQEVQARTKELAQKSAQLEEAFVSTCNLLRVVTHDQRNYMTIIISRAKILASMIQEQPLLRKQIDSILWAADFQKDIIQKISNFESVRSGKSIYELKPCNLKEIIEQSTRTFESQMQSKKLKLVLDSRCPPETEVLIDATIFVTSILNNLLSNAIKFSPENSTILVATTWGTRDHTVELLVKDEGIGMSPSHLAQIFSFTANTTRIGTSGERGTGFGMPIVKSLFEKMGGEITVTSCEKIEGNDGASGTEFRLVIPMKPK